MPTKDKSVLSVDEVPEVQHFMEVQSKIERLKEAYPEVFEKLGELAADYNQALEAADKVLRAKKASCGPFTLSSVAVTYDAEKLHEELGRAEFLKVGGQIKTVTKYDVDKAKFEAHSTSGIVPNEVIESVRTVSPRYKKPEKITGI